MWLISIVRVPDKFCEETGRLMSKAVIHFKESDTVFFPASYFKCGGISALHEAVETQVCGIDKAMEGYDEFIQKEYEETHEDKCVSLDQKLVKK